MCRTVSNFINLAYVRFAGGNTNSPRFIPMSGGPGWIGSERYQIVATAGSDASPEMMQGPMLQALLEDRFKLKLHLEIREVPVYQLTVAKGGLKLQPFKEGSCTPAEALRPPAPSLPGQPPACGLLGIRTKGPNVSLESRGISLDEFSKSALAPLLDRPVIDNTGLAGKFDFHLEFFVDESTPGLRLSPSDVPPAASIFTAIQEQLGLKLESAKGPGEFLVIDSVERPSEN